jgi:hypothetical protein
MYSTSLNRKRYVMLSFLLGQILGVSYHCVSIENIEKNKGIYGTIPGDVKL